MELKPGYKRTEVGVIPEDWEVKLLPQVLRFRNGKAHEQYISDTGRYVCVNSKFISSEGAVRKYSSKNFCPAKTGDILMVMSDLPNGRALAKAYLVDVDDLYAVNQRVCALTADGNHPAYFFYALNRNPYFLKFDDGVSQTHLLNNLFRKCPLPVPPNVNEQRAIAQALSDVDVLLTTLDQMIAKKRDLKRAAMQQLLTGETRLPGFGGDWDVVEFGDVATIRNEKILCSSTPEGTPCVELEFIGQANGRLLGYIEATGASSKYSFKEGDVLFGRLRAYLRKHWRATFDGVCSTEIWPLIPRNERLYKGYLHLLVQMNSFVDAACVSYGTHMPRSDWSVLGKFEVQLPSVPEQVAISASLSDMDAELEALENRLEKTRQLKQAMMQELLTGKTRLA